MTRTYYSAFYPAEDAAGSKGSAAFISSVSSATITLYKRSPTVLLDANKPDNDVIYTFDTANVDLTAVTNGWTTDIPAGTDPIYVVVATVSSTSSSQTILTADWSTPQSFAINGLNTALVRLYKRSASAPSLPTTTATYTFATGALTGHDGGWTTTVPTADGNPLYIAEAIASGYGVSDTILAAEWTAPTILVQDGTAGSPGLNVARVNIYKRSASAPSLPTTTATYTFATGALTGHDGGWTTTVPTTDGNPLYTSAATASSSSATDTIASGEWASAVILAQDGDDGAAGANAKTITVSTDREDFTFDGAANLSPGSQTAVVTANPQNFVGGAVVWSYADNLSTSSATLAALVTATSANVRTIPSTVFSGTLTRTWLRITATGQGAESALSSSVTLYRKNDGTNALVVKLSNEATVVSTDADGSNGNFSSATGLLSVWYGGTDVTSSATLSEVSETACTGTINTSTDTPVTSQPKGYYRVTAMTADVATYKMRAVYNPGSGNITTDKEFSLSRAKRPANMSVTQTRTEITYAPASTPYPASQTTTFTAIKTDSAATVTWTVYDANNVARTPTTTYLSNATGDSVTMTAAQFEAARNGTDMVVLNAVLGSGLVYTGFSLIRRVIATPVLDIILSNPTASISTDDEGNNGDYTGAVGTLKVMYGSEDVTSSATLSEVSESGCTGTINTAVDTPVAGQPKGYYRVTDISSGYAFYTMRAVYNPGSGDVSVDKSFSLGRLMRPSTMSVTQDRYQVDYDYLGALSPSTQTTTFTATKVDSVADVHWQVYDLNGVERTPASTYFSSATGDSVTMTAAQFDSARNGTEGVAVKAVLGVAGTTVGLGIQRRVATPPTATWDLYPTRREVRTDGTGAASPSTQTTVITATAFNITGVTYAWSMVDGDGVSRTPATYGTISGTGNNIYTIDAANWLTASNGTGVLRITCTPTPSTGAMFAQTINMAEVGDGANAQSVKVTADKDKITRDDSGRPWPTTQTTNLSITRNNFTGGTVAWTIKDGNGTVLTPGTYLSATSGDTTSITVANAILAAGSTRFITITGTIGSYADSALIYIDAVGASGGNLWPDPQFITEMSYWDAGAISTPFGFFNNGVSLGYPYANYMRSTYTTHAETLHKVKSGVPCRPSSKLFCGVFGATTTGSAGVRAGIYIKFYKQDGVTQTGTTQKITTSASPGQSLTTAWPEIVPASPGYILTPTDAAWMEFGWIKLDTTSSTQLAYWSNPYVSWNQSGANNTEENIAWHKAPDTNQLVPVSNSGTIKTYITTLNYYRYKGGTDVTSTSTWSKVTTGGITATIGASTGILTISNITGPGYVDITSTRDNVNVTTRTYFEFVYDPVPLGIGNTVSDAPLSSQVSVTNTSYGTTPFVGPYTVSTGSTATLTFFSQLIVRSQGADGELEIKPQYRTPPGSGGWNDAGMLVSSGTVAYSADDPRYGMMGATLAKTSGLSASTAYEVQWLAKIASGSPTSMKITGGVTWVRGQ